MNDHSTIMPGRNGLTGVGLIGAESAFIGRGAWRRLSACAQKADIAHCPVKVGECQERTSVGRILKRKPCGQLRLPPMSGIGALVRRRKLKA